MWHQIDAGYSTSLSIQPVLACQQDFPAADEAKQPWFIPALHHWQAADAVKDHAVRSFREGVIGVDDDRLLDPGTISPTTTARSGSRSDAVDDFILLQPAPSSGAWP